MAEDVKRAVIAEGEVEADKEKKESPNPEVIRSTVKDNDEKELER